MVKHLQSPAVKRPNTKEVVDWCHYTINLFNIGDLNHGGDPEVVLDWLRDKFYDHFGVPTDKNTRESMIDICREYV